MSTKRFIYLDFCKYQNGSYTEAIASKTLIPSIAAEVIPPAYPAPSPQG